MLDLSSTDDFRLFCGDLGNEVNDDVLAKAFSKYPSFNMARVSLTFSTTLFLFSTLPNRFNLLFFIKRMLITSVPGYTGQVDW